MKHFRFVALSALFLLLLAPRSFADMTLIMVEEHGCMWCARWNEEISEIYPKSTEGQAAPLQRIDIDEKIPEGLTFARALHFTPTFVLMLDGTEFDRIEGYPGEDFFWGLLGQMIEKAQTPEVAG